MMCDANEAASVALNSSLGCSNGVVRRTIRRCLAVACVLAVLACEYRSNPDTAQHAARDDADNASPVAASGNESADSRTDDAPMGAERSNPPLAFPVDNANRWLQVVKIRGEAKGGWATGDFDREKNKLTIRTHDVAAFTVDTGLIPIEWKRVVILRIDGTNSELRRREHSTIRFEIGDGGEWVVREP